MAEKKRGLMARLIEGSEKSEGYARSTLPSNRWELFWDIFKGRLGKLFIINLVMVVFLLPLLLILFIKPTFLSTMAGLQPFAQNVGIGYPAIPNLTGLAENVVLQVNSMFYALIPLTALIFSVGFAGGFYVIRNMVWTEGIFVSNDLWRGIKLNYGVIVKAALFYTVILFLTNYSLSAMDLMAAVGSMPNWLIIIGKGATYVLIVLATFMTLFMCTMGVTYKLGFFKLLRNSFLLTIGLLPTNILFLVLTALPFLLLLLGSIFTTLGYILLLTIGISTAMLVWTNYSHWVFDKFINDRVEGAEKNKGIYEKVKKTDSEAVKQYKMQIEQLSASSLSSRPIKPLTDKDLTIAELPANYGRRHLQLLQESKERLAKDHEEYVEKHKNEPKFVQAAEAAAEREREEQEKEQELLNSKKGKKKAKEKKKDTDES